jgi:DNA helicase-2/ATP-dependent DNA helicase PcrA
MLTFKDLNDAQKDAVTFLFKGALKVTAGAGTGKTTVITFRFLEALKNLPGISPSRILCLTFTERAADSMRERITQALGQSARPENLRVHTFHSFCAHVLTQYPALSGLPPGYRVAGEAEIMLLRDDLRASFLSRPLIPPERRSLIPPGSLPDVLRASWMLIDTARRNLHTPETFKAALDAAGQEDTARVQYERQVGAVAARLFREFDAAKRTAGVADYADLINGLYWLLERHDAVREELRSRFAYILVDEFQDTDRAQLELLRLLAGRDFANVTVVGDDKQAIYEWRGARIENLRDFEADERLLSFNYRSYNEILDLANFSITRDPYVAPKAKKIELTNPRKGYSAGGHVYLKQVQSREDEAAYIAGEVQKLVDSGVEPGQIAVLYRATTHTKILENEFRRLGIPYTALGAGFFEREEVRDMLAYLQLASDPRADQAAVRVLERPPVSLPPAQVAQIAAGRQASFLEALRNPQVLEQLAPQQCRRVESALSCIEELRSMRRTAPLPVLVEKALYESGYFDVLMSEASHEAPRSISNVSKIMDLAADFQSHSPLNGLPEFVRYVERLLQAPQLREAEADPQEEAAALKLLTIHAAKGLEFHTVFVADVRAKKFKKDAAFLLDLPPACEREVAGRVIAKRLPGSKDETREYNDLLERRGARMHHEQEERRIFYVALTRARENLYITTAAAKGTQFFDELAEKFASSKLINVTCSPR